MKIKSVDKKFPYEDVDEIDIAFPEESYEDLLMICRLDHSSKIGPHQVTQIFINAVHKLLKGELSQDDLSAIAGHLWDKLEGPAEKKFNKLGSALCAASDLAYYSRRIYDPKKKKTNNAYISLMQTVMQYYAKNKHVIVKNAV